MFSAIVLNEALHFYAFHFSMKNNVKGRHNAESKNIACEHQPIMFFVYGHYSVTLTLP